MRRSPDGRRGSKITPAIAHQDAELVMLFTGGASITEIARAIGLSRERVRQRLKRNGYTGKDHQGWKSTEPWIAQQRRREAKAAVKDARFYADAVKLRALAETLSRTPTLREAALELGAPEKVWQGTGSTPYLSYRAGYRWKRDGPKGYAAAIARLYHAAGLVTRPQGRDGHLNLNPRPLRTHCIRGHEFTPENTYAWKGHRGCRTCGRARRQAYRRKAQQAVEQARARKRAAEADLAEIELAERRGQLVQRAVVLQELRSSWERWRRWILDVAHP